ncbi:flagellar basal body rod protein FlgB [uncultured Metabacillus sp.]|uniref:flagellar basal body rod protein FlgB n=1 Tax=Metabacillus sp. Hm71 TaxID=3450743 RepID=UPI002624FC21|nr:flagellar basal body rod protein FlgB [uncultured Metabacillus sp.]
MKLFSNTINYLEQALSHSMTKQKVIANNIANVDTPNYKAQDVRFHQTLNNELRKLQSYKTDEKHFEFGSVASDYQVVTRANASYLHNGNNVDIDQEMTEMAKNQIQYNALIDRLSSKFSSLKTVIKGGN